MRINLIAEKFHIKIPPGLDMAVIGKELQTRTGGGIAAHTTTEERVSKNFFRLQPTRLDQSLRANRQYKKKQDSDG